MIPAKPSFGEVIGALAFLPAVYVIAWLALFGQQDLRSIALGTLSGVVGAGLGFYLRSRLAPSGNGDSPAGPDAPPLPRRPLAGAPPVPVADTRPSVPLKP